MKKIHLILLLLLCVFTVNFVKAENDLHYPVANAPVAPPVQLLPGDIHGPQYVCANQTNVTYTTDVVAGTVAYNWTVPAGASIVSGQTTNTIVVNFGSTIGNICVSRFDGSVNYPSSCYNISGAASRPNAPASITGPVNTVCPGQTIIYSVAADPLAETYSWTLPANMTLQSGAGTNTITVLVGNNFVWGYLRVSASNCRGASGQTVVSVYSAPVQPGAVTGPAVGACENGTYHYSIAPVNGATSYTWYAPTGCVVTSPVTSGNPLTTSVTGVDITFPAGFTYGRLYISANSGCNSSELRGMDIRSLPLKPGGIRGPFYGVCNLSGVQYSIDSVQGATSYTWSFSPSNQVVINGNGNDTISVDFLPGYTHATFCVTANDVCGSSVARCGVVWAGPAVPMPVNGPTGACNSVPSASVAYYSVPPVFGASGYLWTAPTGASITAGQGTNQITVDFLGASSGLIKAIAQNSCGSSQARTLSIVVNPCKVRDDGSIMSVETKVYPNPAHEKVSVSFESSEGHTSEIKIIDLTGREVYSTMIETVHGLNTQEIDVSEFSKGIYMLSLKNEDSTEITRLIKN